MVEPISSGLNSLYDLIFTTEKVTYKVAHAAYKAKCLILYSEEKLDTNGLEAHIEEYMRRAGIKGVNVKAYTDVKKYAERLGQMIALETEEGKIAGEVTQLLKEITL